MKGKEVNQVGSKFKVSVDSGLEQLEALSRGKDGGRKEVPVHRRYRDKRIGECSCSIFI